MIIEAFKQRMLAALGGTAKKPGRKSALLNRQAPGRATMEMRQLAEAAANAIDPQCPDRLQLLDIYFQTWKDSQVVAEHEKASAFLTTEPFDVCKEGSETADKKRTRLFCRPWFNRFLTLAMDTEFWGYQLVEFGEQDEKGEFTDVSVFPREHVRPFEKQICVNPWDREGIPYEGQETAFFLLPLGEPEDIGKLESIAREVIWKTYARSDWSEYNERFGKPFITYKTDTDSEEEREKCMQMAARFGSDLVGVISDGEELNVTAVASKESSDNYKGLAAFCDEQIAKMINGNTDTSQNGAWTGTAEVHERILTEFTKARLLRIQNIINYRLFPFLIGHGYKLQGYELRFYGLRSKKENTVDNKSYDEPQPAKYNEPGRKDEPDPDGEDGFLGFFGHARNSTR